MEVSDPLYAPAILPPGKEVPHRENIFEEWWYSPPPPPAFLASPRRGGEWSTSRLGLFTPRGNIPRYPQDRRLGGPQRNCVFNA
jgi:hypothetical protein